MTEEDDDSEEESSEESSESSRSTAKQVLRSLRQSGESKASIKAKLKSMMNSSSSLLQTSSSLLRHHANTGYGAYRHLSSSSSSTAHSRHAPNVNSHAPAMIELHEIQRRRLQREQLDKLRRSPEYAHRLQRLTARRAVSLARRLEKEDEDLEELDDVDSDDLTPNNKAGSSLLEQQSVMGTHSRFDAESLGVTPHSHVDKAGDLYMLRMDTDLQRMTQQLDTKLRNMEHDAEYHL